VGATSAFVNVDASYLRIALVAVLANAFLPPTIQASIGTAAVVAMEGTRNALTNSIRIGRKARLALTDIIDYDLVGSARIAHVRTLNIATLVATRIVVPSSVPRAPVETVALIDIGTTDHGVAFVPMMALASVPMTVPLSIGTQCARFPIVAIPHFTSFVGRKPIGRRLALADIVHCLFVDWARHARKRTNGVFALLTQRRTRIGWGEALIYVGATLDGVSLIARLALAFVVDHNGVDTARGALERSHRVAAYLIGRTDCRVGQCALVYIRTCLHGVSLKSHLALALILDGNGIGPARFARKRPHRVDTPFVSRTDNLVGCALVDVGTTLESISLIARHALAAIIDYNGIWSARRAQKGAHCIDASLNYRTDSLVGRNSNTALVDIGATLEGITLVAQ
jgi:hypothetical protein